MPANVMIPFDLQVEVIKRVIPVKSFIRFRSVSKEWKSLIDISQFIIDHSLNENQPHQLLVSYKVDSKETYVSIVDDDNFPHNKFSPIRPPPNVKSFPGHVRMLDCSHGLVCLYCVYDRDINVDGKDVVVLWNPSIRKYVEIVLPHGSKTKFVGVGVSCKTSDPKIVKVSPDQKAEVFTLSTCDWRGISMNLRRPKKSFCFHRNQVVIDGVIHWAAYYYSNAVIISSDLTSEEFEEVALPDSSSKPYNRLIYKLNKSLALVDYTKVFKLCDVWMMTKNGEHESPFTKLYTIDFEILGDSRSYNRIIGFRMNGQPLVKDLDWRDSIRKLKVYEPCSKHFKDLKLVITYGSTISSYAESLLLLNHSTTGI